MSENFQHDKSSAFPPRRLQRPMKLLMTPFTCTQTVRHVYWGKLSHLTHSYQSKNHFSSRLFGKSGGIFSYDGYSSVLTKKKKNSGHNVEYRVHVGALIATVLFLNPPVLPSDTRRCLWPRAKRRAATTSLVAEMNNRNTLKNKSPHGRKKETAKDKNRDRKRMIKLRALRKTFFSRCVFFSLTGFGWGAGRRAPQKTYS